MLALARETVAALRRLRRPSCCQTCPCAAPHRAVVLPAPAALSDAAGPAPTAAGAPPDLSPALARRYAAAAAAAAAPAPAAAAGAAAVGGGLSARVRPARVLPSHFGPFRVMSSRISESFRVHPSQPESIRVGSASEEAAGSDER
jgi:hypothetical protein